MLLYNLGTSDLDYVDQEVTSKLKLELKNEFLLYLKNWRRPEEYRNIPLKSVLRANLEHKFKVKITNYYVQ